MSMTYSYTRTHTHNTHTYAWMFNRTYTWSLDPLDPAGVFRTGQVRLHPLGCFDGGAKVPPQTQQDPGQVCSVWPARRERLSVVFSRC